jgi:hypothetical protein
MLNYLERMGKVDLMAWRDIQRLGILAEANNDPYDPGWIAFIQQLAPIPMMGTNLGVAPIQPPPGDADSRKLQPQSKV